MPGVKAGLPQKRIYSTGKGLDVKRSNFSSGFVLVLASLVVTVSVAGQPGMPAIPQVSNEPLHQAAMAGNEAAVKKFIDEGANVNALDNAKLTPLVCAAMSGNVNICKLLLAAKADPNVPGAEMSPVAAAVMVGGMMGAMGATVPAMPGLPQHTEVVKILVDAGASVDANGPEGQTPLAMAVEAGAFAMVEVLLEKGANPNKAGLTATPLQAAEAKLRDMNRIVELMRAKGRAAMPPGAGPGRRSVLDRAALTARDVPALPPEGVTPPAGPTAADANEAIILAILADANNVLARARAIPEVNAPVMSVDAKARSEESGWRSRTTDNRATLVRAVERQFNEEMAVIKKIAAEEKATKTVSDINNLMAKRGKRYAAIYEEMRLARQTAAAENPTTGRGRGGNMGTGMTGRGNRGTMGGEAMAPAPVRPMPRRNAEANAGANDPSYDTQVQAWSSSNFEDKRDLLANVHELDLKELELLDDAARQEKAEKTSAAIEALMVLRQQRVTRIGAAMEKDDIRLQRQADRGITPGTRGGRGGMTGQQQQGMRGGRY